MKMLVCCVVRYCVVLYYILFIFFSFRNKNKSKNKKGRGCLTTSPNLLYLMLYA